jgi:hypothetical protein
MKPRLPTYYYEGSTWDVREILRGPDLTWYYWFKHDFWEVDEGTGEPKYLFYEYEDDETSWWDTHP